MPSKRKIALISGVIILVFVGWIGYEIFFSRTNQSIVESVSGLELDGTYDIRAIQDDWSDPTSTNSDGTTYLTVNLTTEQCSLLVKQASNLNYQSAPITYNGSMGLPPEIIAITDGIFRMKVGNPDDRDVEISAIDVAHNKLYVYFRVM